MTLLLIILFLAMSLDAIGDACRLNKRIVMHHIAEAMQVACYVSALLLVYIHPIPRQPEDIGWLIAFIVSARITFFDYLFNIAAGLKLGFIGNTSLWDRFRCNGGDFIKIMSLLLFIFSILNLSNLIIK